jgi:hypothetical protein
MPWISLLFFLLCSFGYADINKKIEKLPSEDREKIDFLFRFLVQRDTLGYVLFGENKCMTFSPIPLTHKEYVLPYSKLENPLEFQNKLKESWSVWKQYESWFEHTNILICEEYERIENEIYLQIFLIDKKKLRSVLTKYRDDFIEVLGKAFTVDAFIEKLEKMKKLRPLIKHDEKLLGILLGFGRLASTAFRDLKNQKVLDPPLECLGKRPSGCLITPVSFRGYSQSEETRQLLESYKKEILDIEAIFKSDSFLERTLEKLCAP